MGMNPQAVKSGTSQNDERGIFCMDINISDYQKRYNSHLDAAEAALDAGDTDKATEWMDKAAEVEREWKASLTAPQTDKKQHREESDGKLEQNDTQSEPVKMATGQSIAPSNGSPIEEATMTIKPIVKKWLKKIGVFIPVATTAVFIAAVNNWGDIVDRKSVV